MTRADQARKAAKIALARKSLEHFTTWTYEEYNRGQHDYFHVNWHHRVIFEHLEAWRTHDIQKLIITTPPRRSKSEIVCRRLIPWLLGHDPNEDVLYFTHTTKFAQSQGLDVRRVMETKRYREAFDTRFDGDPTLTGFDTEAGGQFIPLGIREGSAGEDASRVIVDDYHRNREDARSPAARQRVFEAFTDDIMPRMYYPSSAIIMATRWHHDDLIGRIQDSPEADDWHVIHLPEIMDVEDPPSYDPREPGEPLFPWWFKEHDDVPDEVAAQRAVDHFEKVKQRNAFTAESLYQGRPTPREGGLFKREFIQQYDADPRRMAKTADDIVISVDATFKNTDTADYVSMVVMARRGREYYVLDERFDRMDFSSTKRALVNLASKWPRATVLIEAKANGPALISDLRSHVNRVIPYEPTDSKQIRAQMAADTCEAGQVYFPTATYAPWVGDFIEDLVGFPGRAHDDRVDAFAQALIRWTSNEDAIEHLRRICTVG